MNKKVVVFLTLMLAANIANATLIGDTVDVWRGTDTTVYYSASEIVDETVEITNDTNYFQIDITGDSIVFTSLANNWWFSDLVPALASFYEYRFTDLDFSGGESIVDLDLSGFGYDVSRVSFTADSLTIDVNNFQPTWNVGDTWTIGFVTSSSVPAPASIVLLGLGLVGLGFSRRKSVS